MIDFGNFYSLIAKIIFHTGSKRCPRRLLTGSASSSTGCLSSGPTRWNFCLKLNRIVLILLHSVTAESEEPLSAGQIKRIETLMRNLMPWRKGPFSLYGVNIDTEWRSDWKWDRVLPHLSDLTGRTILDVGCGSGYHSGA